ncbi:MAG: transporter substrate-binding protein [Polyangiaceae bacterium]|jgi:ABC-type nitrate/sulfonate/bicarbonate transport system substrate-binding protein|nr:transporter substrate-binding protein [Polyangiaceae bacterium]
MHWTRIAERLGLLLLVLTCAIGCKGAKPDQATPSIEGNGPEQLELRYQGFTGQVTYPELAEDLGLLAPIKLNYVGNTISGPQDIQSVVTGDTDYGGAFNGAVIKLIAAKAPIKAVVGYYGTDENTWAGYYVLEDSPIKGARDLIGKKVAVNTLGAHMEFVLREYLARGGLRKEEVDQVTLVVVPPVSGEQALRQKQVEVATMSSIIRDKAVSRGGLRLLFSDYQLFGKFTAGSYVFSERFLREKPRTVKKFVEGTAQAIEWARSHTREEVIARYTAIINKRRRQEDASAVAYYRSTGIAFPGGVIQDSELRVWLDWLVKSGQLSAGKLQVRDLYTNQYNPFANGPT